MLPKDNTKPLPSIPLTTMTELSRDLYTQGAT